jgi:hypothetical protein
MKDWTSAEHIGKISVSMITVLAKEFHKHSSKKDEEKNYDLIIKLSQAAGYQCQLYSALQKSHEYERRLQSVEKTVKTVTSEDLAMLNNPVIKAEAELKTDENFR